MKTKIVDGGHAPEGGWGWLIVAAYSLNNVMVIPVFQVFGLVYRDLFSYLQLTAADASAVVTVNLAFGMLFGIFNGPILKYFGYRKVAVTGALMFFVGNVLTSQAFSFVEFILYYSLLVSLGTNLLMASFSLALNTYFVKKRGVATGIAMTITSIGPITMPILTSFLMKFYGIHGTGLILSALSLHSLAAALLLQPVKWHIKQEKGVEMAEKTPINREIDSKINTEGEQIESDDQKMDLLHEQNNEQILPLHTESAANSKSAASKMCEKKSNLDKRSEPKCLDDVVKNDRSTCWKKVVDLFDFDLLKDYGYVNIALGLSLAFIGETNFSLMIPFIFKDRNYNTAETATIMSTIAGADVMSRFISPFIGSRTKLHSRTVYLISLAVGIIFRAVLSISYSYRSVICISVGLGIAKGIRSVYMAIIIPNYVPLNKLPSATGLQMVLNGILLMISGPLLGTVRDKSANYDNWIHVINGFSTMTILMWIIEMVLMRKNKPRTDVKDDELATI